MWTTGVPAAQPELKLGYSAACGTNSDEWYSDTVVISQVIHTFISLLVLSSGKMPAASGQVQWKTGNREEPPQPLDQVCEGSQISRSSSFDCVLY